MSKINLRSAGEIISQFNSTVKTLITKISRKSRDDRDIANLDRLNRRINLLKNTMGDSILIIEAAPVFIENSECILEPDPCVRERTFLACNFQEKYLAQVGAVDTQDEFIFMLIDPIRKQYINSSSLEKEELYKLVKILFECCVEYSIVAPK